MRPNPNLLNLIERAEFPITVSHLLEYLYCPRFTYFQNYLDIPQYEEKRFKVQKGRTIHEDKQRINPDYLRKKMGCIERKLKGIEPLNNSLLFYRILDLIGSRAINGGSILSELEAFSEYCMDNNMIFLKNVVILSKMEKFSDCLFLPKNC